MALTVLIYSVIFFIIMPFVLFGLLKLFRIRAAGLKQALMVNSLYIVSLITLSFAMAGIMYYGFARIITNQTAWLIIFSASAIIIFALAAWIFHRLLAKFFHQPHRINLGLFISYSIILFMLMLAGESVLEIIYPASEYSPYFY